ncbi:MAG: hypothetical protein IPF92_21060 [Myxococcales bacterium]|nr:hypothetical protein [Myxococcales bacterium]
MAARRPTKGSASSGTSARPARRSDVVRGDASASSAYSTSAPNVTSAANIGASCQSTGRTSEAAATALSTSWRSSGAL